MLASSSYMYLVQTLVEYRVAIDCCVRNHRNVIVILLWLSSYDICDLIVPIPFID